MKPLMRILAASDIALDSIRAHAINVIKTAGGFRRARHEVLLLCRPPQDEPVASALAALGEGDLPVECLAAGDSPSDREDAFGDWTRRAGQRWGADLIYARHFAAAAACARAGIPTVLETHAYRGDPNPRLEEAFALTRSAPLAISTISHRLREHYVERGALPQRVAVIPDAVDVDLFAPPATIPPSPYPTSGPNITYAGHLYDYKGVPTILDAAAHLPDAQFHLVGGADDDIIRVRAAVQQRELCHVHVRGRVPHIAVPPWLWHADVLLLPPSAREPSKDWTSPVKLGEYLASGTPIVCSHIPALRDWLPPDLVEWCIPDDAASLAKALGRTLEMTSTERTRRQAAAAALAGDLSYASRARRLLQLHQPRPQKSAA